MSTPSPLWDAEQVAAHLGLSLPHIYLLARENRLPYVRIGRALRFRPAEIEAWIEAKVVKAVQ